MKRGSSAAYVSPEVRRRIASQQALLLDKLQALGVLLDAGDLTQSRASSERLQDELEDYMGLVGAVLDAFTEDEPARPR